MTPEHNQHLKSIASEAEALILRKYIKGQREHGGNLWEMPASKLLDNAIDEAVDQVIYLLTLRQTMRRVI